MIEILLLIALAVFPLGYFFSCWIAPPLIKKMLMKKGYGIEFVKSFLKQRYAFFYDWIPKFLLK